MQSHGVGSGKFTAERRAVGFELEGYEFWHGLQLWLARWPEPMRRARTPVFPSPSDRYNPEARCRGRRGKVASDDGEVLSGPGVPLWRPSPVDALYEGPIYQTGRSVNSACGSRSGDIMSSKAYAMWMARGRRLLSCDPRDGEPI